MVVIWGTIKIPTFKAKMRKLVTDYNNGKISKIEFQRRYDELMQVPGKIDNFFGSKDKKE